MGEPLTREEIEEFRKELQVASRTFGGPYSLATPIRRVLATIDSLQARLRAYRELETAARSVRYQVAADGVVVESDDSICDLCQALEELEGLDAGKP